ncbi:MAG TPA: right-handed parallel beta-helix repeat-containing protein, partial [Armatimonadota bacterium]
MRIDAHLVSVLCGSHIRLFKLLLCTIFILAFMAYPVGAAQNRAPGDIIYVDSTATGTGDGSSWENAYRSLTSALTAAQNGEILYVAEGTYTPGALRSSTFAIPSTAKLYGGFPTGGAPFGNQKPSDHPTILSGELGLTGDSTDNAYHVVTVSSAATGTLIDGFIIQDGNSAGAPENAGGGIRITGSTVTVATTAVQDNLALAGAGIYVTGSNATFTHVSIHNNISADDDTGSNGGGMAAENNPSIIITGSDISGNQALYGAGIYLLSGNTRIIRSEVHDNLANGTASHPGSGGGVYAAGPVTILSSQVYANTAACGDGNASGANGAGIYSAGTQTNFYNSVLWVNQFSDDCAGSGAGIYATQNVAIRSSTLVHNAGTAVYATGSQVSLANAIVWANTLHDGSGSLQVTYSLVQGGYAGPGNLSVDPQFINEIEGNYRIGPGSPAIDAGDNSAVPADSADLDADGNTAEPLPLDFDQLGRFFDMPTRADAGSGSAPLVDMGAWEVRNTAPVLPGSSALALPDLPRNTLDPTGTQLSDLLAGLPAPGITDADPEAVPGIAIIAADNAHGKWQFATPGATNYTDIGTVSEASALLLAVDSGDKLRFVPAPGYVGAVFPGLTFRAWDHMDGYPDGQAGVGLLGTGDAWPYSAATGTISVDVLDVNTSPTLDPIAGRTVLEDSGTILVDL